MYIFAYAHIYVYKVLHFDTVHLNYDYSALCTLSSQVWQNYAVLCEMTNSLCLSIHPSIHQCSEWCSAQQWGSSGSLNNNRTATQWLSRKLMYIPRGRGVGTTSAPRQCSPSCTAGERSGRWRKKRLVYFAPKHTGWKLAGKNKQDVVFQTDWKS